MGDLNDDIPGQEYTKIAGSGNKSGEIRDIIDPEKFPPVRTDMYQDTKEASGRPHNDEVLMIKMLICAISRRHSPGERPYTVIKRSQNAGHVLVTTPLRFHVKNPVSCFCCNLFNLISRKHAGRKITHTG